MPEDLSILTENGGGKHSVVSIVGTKNGSTVCSIIQMQVKIGDGNDPTDRILAFSTAYVNLPNEITLHDHIFLAGCSYQYDLELGKNIHIFFAVICYIDILLNLCLHI